MSPQEHGLDIHPHALRLITQSLKLIDAELRANPEANRLFLEILTSRKDPETTLRRMNEAGVFGRFVPDFGRVVAQMQYDMYHVYTVDEHTLFAIGILHQIETGELKEELPLATSLMPTIDSRRALYLAVLLHDIAKGRGGDHSMLGDEVAEKLGPRLGFTAEETETVAWLVRWHLADEQHRLQARHRRPPDHPRLRRARAVAGAAEAAAASSPSPISARSAPRSGTAGRRRCCASSIIAPSSIMSGGLSSASARDAARHGGAGGGARICCRISRGGVRTPSSPRAIRPIGSPSIPRPWRAMRG